MTNEESIKIEKYLLDGYKKPNYKLAEKIMEAVEKQIPKKPHTRDLWELGTAKGYSCPACKYDFPVNYTEPCCCKCGQVLDRSDTE